jgi:broad specificity phosphatase PhoE
MTIPPDEFARRLEVDVSDPFLSPKRGSTEILLIRHADALPSAEEVVAGGYDEQALSELGRRQALALAERLRPSARATSGSGTAALPLAAVYSSPIARAHQTARAVAEAHGFAVRIEEDLREVRLGPVGPDVFASLMPQELTEALRTRLQSIALLAVSSGGWSGIPGSEPSAELRERITGALARIAIAHPGERVAAVSHAGSINAYFAELLGIERDYFFPTANTSISVVRIKGERRLLLALNDVAHLHQADLLG